MWERVGNEGGGKGLGMRVVGKGWDKDCGKHFRFRWQESVANEGNQNGLGTKRFRMRVVRRGWDEGGVTTPSMGMPLMDHLMSGLGTPPALQWNSASSSSDEFTSSGASIQNGIAATQHKYCCFRLHSHLYNYVLMQSHTQNIRLN